jgi:exodeoxyribonuclease V beta subunit
MVWGNIKDAENSAPAWLLHRRSAAQGAARAFGADDAPDLTDMNGDLERLAKRAEGRMRVSPMPAAAPARPAAADDAAPLTAARAFSGTLRDAHRVTSFTALAHGRSIEAPDYDAVDIDALSQGVTGRDHASDKDALRESVSGRDIFAFPRGAQAGKCIHSIFEHADFARPERTELERIVTRSLSAHGFDAVWVCALADMVEAVVKTPLDASGMRLSAVTRERRLDELEFYYPLGHISDEGLRRVLREGGFPEEIRSRIEALSFHPTQGYMTGFIDLVFEHEGRYYLVDYKSNWLGATPDAYRPVDLARSMGREAYYLQYLIYCVALHRYLGNRVSGYRYDTHFGGVRYLYVRGMRPDFGADCGVFADRPAEALITALDAYLCEGILA